MRATLDGLFIQVIYHKTPFKSTIFSLQYIGMKILYIITQADGGGAQKYTLALARHFNGAIAAGNEANKLFIDAQRVGLTTFELKYLKRNLNLWNDLMAVWEIHQLIKTYKPDIVHLNSTKAGILGSFAAIGTKTKVIFTAHGFVFNEPLSLPLRNFYLSLEKIASGYRDFIITVSDVDRQSALNNKIISADKITTIHNGLSPVSFLNRDQARAELGLSGILPPLPLGEGRGEGFFKDKIIIGSTSNFYRTKGLDVLIRAVAMLDESTKSKINVIIIGDGPERRNLELGVRSYRLENIIKLLGKKGNAAIYLRAFDYFVLPSRKEGFPFALLEAMQAGLPIVATNVGGIPEALGGAGILITPEDPKALTDAIHTILLDSNIVKNLSTKAQERSQLFTEEKMLAETEKIYRLIIKKPESK
jgi:glycosyltransferase involved in cell wall biosynthesis